MSKSIGYLNKNTYLIFIFFYATIILSIYFEENSLSGAKDDYLYHLKFIYLFRENSIFEGLARFASSEYRVRNSPAFYIIYGNLNKFISLDILQKLNSVVSLLIAFYFFKCLAIRYKKVATTFLALLSCVVFLSPTLRSLSIWPYPLAWGIFFFIISIYNYLKFQIASKNSKFKYSIYTTLFLSLSSYLHPPLALFNIFYLIKFFKFFSFKLFFYVLMLNLILAFPAIKFAIDSGFYFLHNAEGLALNENQSLNFFNKIIIISGIILYYILPLLNPRELYNKVILKVNYKILISLVIITIFFSFFFNYNYTIFFGGGFVHKISYLFFKNYILLYLFFLFSLMIFFVIFDKKFINYLIYSIIILTNIQYTIYNKYYDILVIIVFLLLCEIDFKKLFFVKKNSLIYLYLAYFFYYIITVYKNSLYTLFS